MIFQLKPPVWAGSVWFTHVPIRWLAAGMLATLLSVNAAEPVRSPTHPGTARMVERLRHSAERANPLKNGFLSLERARHLGRELRGTTNYQQLAELGPLFAGELLQSGQSEAALKQFRLLESFYTRFAEFGGPAMAERVHLGQAIAALRLGEQENCILNHTAESCLFPLQPHGKIIWMANRLRL